MLYTDQIGHSIELNRVPKRVISIVPSQSEFLWDIGLRNELVGITKFCIHPDEMFKGVERVGGTKELNLDKIRALQPELIIGNKEENDQKQIEQLQAEFNVWMSDIYTFDDAFNMMKQIGVILGRDEKCNQLLEEFEQILPPLRNSFQNKSVAYFIWNKPYLFAARNTFINFVLSYLGFQNVLSVTERYPELSLVDLEKLKPDYCFLSSEPFPFGEKHTKEIQAALPFSRVILTDGEMFSWYGSRLLQLPAYTEELKRRMEQAQSQK